MSRRLPNAATFLAAVRRLLGVAGSENEPVDEADSRSSETPGPELANLEAQERRLRAELRRVDRRVSGSLWGSWQAAHYGRWSGVYSGDGFERERTLRSLSGGAPNSLLFAFALRRLNDWVPQVRAAAREHLPRIAERTDREHIVDALWYTLPFWSTWGRSEESDRQALVDIISVEGVALALRSRIVKATAGPAAAVLAQAGRSPALDQWLDEIAEDAVQPAVRAKAYRCLLEGRMVWVSGRKWKWVELKWANGRFEPVLSERPLSIGRPFLEILRMAAADRSAMVRRVAGDLLVRRRDSIGADALTMARQLASDPYPSVAECGRFVLENLKDPK